MAAHKWLNLATSRAKGKDRATYAKFRDSLTNRMTPAQLAEAQRRARDWVPTVSSRERSAPVETATASWRRAEPSPIAILQLKPEDSKPSPAADMFERSAAGVAGLKGDQGTGTAFFITRDGLALTNHHVVANQGTLRATLRDGRQLAVRVLRSNPDADVALIQIDCSNDCYTLSLAGTTRRSGPRST